MGTQSASPLPTYQPVWSLECLSTYKTIVQWNNRCWSFNMFSKLEYECNQQHSSWLGWQLRQLKYSNVFSMWERRIQSTHYNLLSKLELGWQLRHNLNIPTCWTWWESTIQSTHFNLLSKLELPAIQNEQNGLPLIGVHILEIKPFWKSVFRPLVVCT